MIRVMIADDHAVVRQPLRIFLDLDPDLTVIGEAVNGLEAVEMVRELGDLHRAEPARALPRAGVDAGALALVPSRIGPSIAVRLCENALCRRRPSIPRRSRCCTRIAMRR